MNRILKKRLRSQTDDGHMHHHQLGNSRDPQKRATTSSHQQGNRHRSDSEIDKQYQKFPEHVTPMDPRTAYPLSKQDRGPTLQNPRVPSSQVSGAPRRHTVDSPHSSRVEHYEYLAHKPVTQVRSESGVNQKRKSSIHMSQQQQPMLSSSTTSGPSAHTSPDFVPSMAGHTHAHSSLSPSHTSITGKGRKRVAHKSEEEIKSQRQEHKLSTPVSPTLDPAPPSKRPRVRSTSGGSSSSSIRSSKGGIRADLLKKMTKK